MKYHELKARALVLSCIQLVGNTETAKMAALIAVSEILDDVKDKTFWLKVKDAIQEL